MIEQVRYNIDTYDGMRRITITPINQIIPGGNLYSTGVYKLSDGDVGLGEIVFDDEMKDWEYTGLGEFTYDESEEIAEFIREHEESQMVPVYR